MISHDVLILPFFPRGARPVCCICLLFLLRHAAKVQGVEELVYQVYAHENRAEVEPPGISSSHEVEVFKHYGESPLPFFALNQYHSVVSHAVRGVVPRRRTERVVAAVVVVCCCCCSPC